MSRLIFSCVVTCVMSTSAGAQCVASWLPGSPSPTLFYSGNIVGQVVGSTVWDPDADGPLAPRWVVGGSMGTIGGVAVNNVAAFDGNAWTSFPPLEHAWSLADYRSELIAGGFYGVKRLNGAAWENLGTFPGTAWTLHVHDDELFAGGGLTAAGVRRWDGIAWQSLADATFTGLSTRVSAFVSYGGDLIVGGTFLDVAGLGSRGVARWDGAAWHAMNTGLAAVNALVVHNNAVIAGGDFLVPGSTTSRNVARWDGAAWVPMGGGVPIPVLCFTEHDGQLYAAGEGASRTVYRWAGSAWESVLTPATNDELSPDAEHLVSFQGELYAAGRASSATGESARHVGVLRWAGDHWRTLHDAPNYHTGGFALYNNELYCYGSFHTFAGRGARRVARLTPEGWRPVGGGIGTPPGGNPVSINDAVESTTSWCLRGPSPSRATGWPRGTARRGVTSRAAHRA